MVVWNVVGGELWVGGCNGEKAGGKTVADRPDVASRRVAAHRACLPKYPGRYPASELGPGPGPSFPSACFSSFRHSGAACPKSTLIGADRGELVALLAACSQASSGGNWEWLFLELTFHFRRPANTSNCPDHIHTFHPSPSRQRHRCSQHLRLLFRSVPNNTSAAQVHPSKCILQASRLQQWQTIPVTTLLWSSSSVS